MTNLLDVFAQTPPSLHVIEHTGPETQSMSTELVSIFILPALGPLTMLPHFGCVSLLPLPAVEATLVATAAALHVMTPVGGENAKRFFFIALHITCEMLGVLAGSAQVTGQT